MNPATIIQKAAADGVTLALTPAGTIKITGDTGAVQRWQAVLHEHKRAIVAALREAANDAGAVTAQPVSEPPRRSAEQAGELRRLLDTILANASNTDRAEALAVALADPDAALTSFRLLAHDLRERAIWGQSVGGSGKMPEPNKRERETV